MQVAFRQLERSTYPEQGMPSRAILRPCIRLHFIFRTLGFRCLYTHALKQPSGRRGIPGESVGTRAPIVPPPAERDPVAGGWRRSSKWHLRKWVATGNMHVLDWETWKRFRFMDAAGKRGILSSWKSQPVSERSRFLQRSQQDSPADFLDNSSRTTRRSSLQLIWRDRLCPVRCRFDRLKALSLSKGYPRTGGRPSSTKAEASFGASDPMGMDPGGGSPQASRVPSSSGSQLPLGGLPLGDLISFLICAIE